MSRQHNRCLGAIVGHDGQAEKPHWLGEKSAISPSEGERTKLSAGDNGLLLVTSSKIESKVEPKCPIWTHWGKEWFVFH